MGEVEQPQASTSADDEASLRMAYIRARQQEAGPAYAAWWHDGVLGLDNRAHHFRARFDRGSR